MIGGGVNAYPLVTQSSSRSTTFRRSFVHPRPRTLLPLGWQRSPSPGTTPAGDERKGEAWHDSVTDAQRSTIIESHRGARR